MIELKIPRGILEDRGHEMLASADTVLKLRAAGIPVVGTLVVRSVERGVLSVHTDAISGERVFQWRDDAPISQPTKEDLFQ